MRPAPQPRRLAPPPPARLALALALLLAEAARADGVSAHLEPGWFATQDDVTDQGGARTRRRTHGLTQNYQLLVDKDLFRNLKASAGGTFQQTKTWVSGDAVPSTRFDDTTKDGFARLTFSIPALRLGAGVERNERSTSAGSDLVTDQLSATAAWHAADLPEVDVQATRTHAWRPGDASIDATTTAALVGARYDVNRLELRYLFGYALRDDAGAATESRSIDQTAQASYGDTFFDRRTSAYFSTTISNRQLSILSRGPEGTIQQQQAPIAGLSLVESFPAQPAEDTLAPNAALVDGNLSAGAAINIGFTPGLTDQSFRDVGGQFADRATPVNTIYVFTDKALTPELAAAFSWTAWQSDDNLRWTAVPITRPVALGVAQNRFEIQISTTRARYLKVVTAPLRPGVTTDRRFADVFVTEIQFWNVVLASALPRDQASTNGAATATVRTALLRGERNLSHDVSLQLARITSPGLTTWSLVNGLSYAQKLGRTWALDARVSHRDEDFGSGREGQDDWGATLTARPLPTLSHALSYSGTLHETRGTLTNSITSFNRAELYEGVSAQANLGASLSRLQQEQNSASTLANVTVALTPNRWVTASAGWAFTSITSFGPDQPTTTSFFERVDGTLSVTPSPAVAASGTVARIIRGPRPTTLASLQVTYAPFRGDLQLSLAYARSLDTAADATTQLVSPALRWNVRRNLYLTASYSLLDVTARVQSTRSRVFAASVVVYL